MLTRAVLWLTVRSGSAFLLRPSYLVTVDTVPCRVVRLQIRLQNPFKPDSPAIDCTGRVTGLSRNSGQVKSGASLRRRY